MNDLIEFKGINFSDSWTLLIGNGFSRMINSNFDYKKLIDRLNIESLKDIVEETRIYNAEILLDRLNKFYKQNVISDHLFGDENRRSYVKEFIDKFKSAFNDQLHEIHSFDFKQEIGRHGQDLVCNFFNNFKTIFTINYDLLLYWTLLECNLVRNKFNDGFKNNIWYDPFLYFDMNFDRTNLYFLHGALHVFESNVGDNYSIYKLIQLRNNHHGCGYIKVLDQIKERLAQGHIPLIVFEGESDNKLRSISSSIYLRHCFDILSQSEGKLLIFGVSFENDQHIINAISKSKISDIFIGVYDEDDRIMYQDKFSSCEKKYIISLVKKYHLYRDIYEL